MAEFTFGLNMETLIFIFCVVLSSCVLVTIGYFVGNKICNKKSNGVTSTKSLKEEETGWTSDNFEKLKDKIKLANVDIFVDKYSISLDIPDLLDCVTHTFTLKYNDPKLMNDSNFDSRVKQLITDCKKNMRKTEEDPDSDSDPGPPVWSPSVIKKFKAMMKGKLTIESYDPAPTQRSPTSEQLDCIVKKLQSEFKNPRDMLKIFRTNQEKTKELIIRIASECNYKIVPNMDQEVIIWDNDTLLMLKDKLRSLYVNADFLNDDELKCLAGKISRITNDPTVITNPAKLTALISPSLILECKQKGSSTLWTPEDLSKTIIQMSGVLSEKLGKEPSIAYLNCFVIKIMEKFPSLAKVKEQDRVGNLTYISEFMNHCGNSVENYFNYSITGVGNFGRTPHPTEKVVQYTEAEWVDINNYPPNIAKSLLFINNWADMIRNRDSAKMRRAISNDKFNKLLDNITPENPFIIKDWTAFEKIPRGVIFTLLVPTNIFNSVISNKDNEKMLKILQLIISKDRLSSSSTGNSWGATSLNKYNSWGNSGGSWFSRK